MSGYEVYDQVGFLMVVQQSGRGVQQPERARKLVTKVGRMVP
jgi:hypothetical protein